MKQEDKDVPGRRITHEYYADGEWHYIGITLYNNLTDRIQFGNEYTTEFLANNKVYYIKRYLENGNLYENTYAL